MTIAVCTGSATINITFTPAAAPVQPFESYAVPVTSSNQSTNWTGVLVPIPAPGALSISFMSQGKYYQLRDNGTGRLFGASESIGSGTINYQTGTWLLTTGALPDVGTPILLQWGSPISTFTRSDLAVLPASLNFILPQAGVAVGVDVSWLLDGVAKTATSNSQGQFTGDATGTINYATGEVNLKPNKLPSKNTVFTFDYDYGEPDTQTVSSGAPDGTQKITFTIGTGPAIQPNTVQLDIPVQQITGGGNAGVVVLHDVPIDAVTGNLVNQLGNIQGTITYATGVCEVTATTNKTIISANYSPVKFATVYGSA